MALNVSWRDYEMLKPENLSWQQIYEQHFEHIEENYFNMNNCLDTEESEDMDIVLHVESLRDCMHASASGPSNVNQQIELGMREHDIRHI